MIIRHADPDYAHDTITDLGHREAAALGRWMAGVGLTALYTSPLGRARATADYIAQETGLAPTVLPWTAELQIEAQVTDPRGVTGVAFNLPGEYVRRGPAREWGQHFLDDEHRRCAEQVAIDSDMFMAEHGYVRDGGVYRVEHDNDDIIAVVCHAGFGVTWLGHLLGLPIPLAWCGFFWAPTSVTTVVTERRSEQWAVPRALSVGDTTHLRIAGLPESSRGLPANAR